MKKTEWLEKMMRMLDEIIEASKAFTLLDDAWLNFRSTQDSWSILQCFNHLNLYNRYYLNELQHSAAKVTAKEDIVKFSWIGNKSITMMEPSAIKKRKTFKHMQPTIEPLSRTEIDKFLNDQKLLNDILTKASNDAYSLNIKGVRVEFMKLLSMYNGETIEFMLTHELRHVRQAMQAVKLKNAVDTRAALIV